MSFFSKPKMPPIPPVPPPIAIPETDEKAGEPIRKRLARGSRARTVITGDLTPKAIGKKTLLG